MVHNNNCPNFLKIKSPLYFSPSIPLLLVSLILSLSLNYGAHVSEREIEICFHTYHLPFIACDIASFGFFFFLFYYFFVEFSQLLRRVWK